MQLKILLICGALFLMGCNAVQNTNGQESTTTDSPRPQWLTLEGEADMPNIVLISGDEEYRSEEALPQLARILNEHHGYNCTVLFAQNPEEPGLVDPNYVHNIPGLDQLNTADLMIIFTRFRALPDEQMQHIDNYLKRGKPLMGIRTATHAFQYDKEDSTSYAHYSNSYGEEDAWKGGFGRLVLGEKWIAHHGHHKHQSTRGIVASAAEGHPIWQGIESGDIWGPTDVYRVRLPLPDGAQALVLGQVINRAGEYDEGDALYGMQETDAEVAAPNLEAENAAQRYDPNGPMMPVAWTKTYQIPNGQKGKVFATTLGASTDLLSEGTRRMFVNAVYWCLDRDVPEKAKVDLVGDFNPSPFAFHDDEHWVDKNIRIADLIAQ